MTKKRMIQTWCIALAATIPAAAGAGCSSNNTSTTSAVAYDDTVIQSMLDEESAATWTPSSEEDSAYASYEESSKASFTSHEESSKASFTSYEESSEASSEVSKKRQGYSEDESQKETSTGNPELERVSTDMTNAYKGYTLAQTIHYLHEENNIPLKRIRYSTTQNEAAENRNEWVVDRVEFTEESIVLYISRCSMTDTLKKQIIGKRYDDAKKILKATGLDCTFQEQLIDDDLTIFEEFLGVQDEKNWSVQDATIKQLRDGTLSVNASVHHDEKGVIGSIVHVFAELIWDDYKNEHPILGTIIEGWLSAV